MNNQLTEILFVLDRSGSMGSVRNDAIGGFNTFLEDQKKQPGAARLTLVLFDTTYTVVHDGADLRAVPPLTEVTYAPRGGTAMLDAIGRGIVTVGERLARTPEAERPGKVIVAILTDGEENCSREYSPGMIARLIKQQREEYSWEFLFLAANIDATTTAAALNIDPGQSVAFAATSFGTQVAFESFSKSVSRSRAII